MINIIFEFFSNLRIVDVIDMLLVLYLLYELYNLLKGTAGINMFFGIVTVYLLWKLVVLMEMRMLGEILGQFISVGVIALIIVFQQEIRKFLLLLGNAKFINKKRKRFLFWNFNIAQEVKLNIDEVCKAIKRMALNQTGALIVITRKNQLEDIIITGVAVDAIVSDQLIENIFFKNTPLHDGAVIIIDNRIVAAKCILPVTDWEGMPENVGLRHRAAVGVSEVSDAIAITVSEQTGEISIADNGYIKTNLKVSELKDFLREEFFDKVNVK